jgi:hypothetical protein
MNTSNAQQWIILTVVVLGLIAVAWLAARQQRERRTRRLQTRFGPEYSRVVAERGDLSKAESELLAREARVERLKIVPLAPAEAARFSEAWDTLQSRFVDNPKGVVIQADKLVREVMIRRGYPMADFEHRAADISVDHAALVDNYRSAQAIAVRDERGEASTEELRRAVVYYRALFDELLEVGGPRAANVQTQRRSMQS